MDFSAWNWATSFRLHEAACLIAGVMPISKRQPTTEELPSQARPILVKLMAAYVEWHLQKRNPDRPKSTFLEGYLNDDGALPEINSLAELPGALASREAINRFLLQIEGELGLKSAYDFGPICKTADPFSTDDQHPTQRTPTPDEPALDFNPQPDPAIATQHLVLDGFVPISGAINQGRAQVLEWLNAPREKLPQECQDAFALWCEIDAIDQQVRELETTQPVGVTEILARRAALKELHTERARLLAVLDDSEPPQLAPVEPCASTRPDYSMLATRAQLIQAFGAFTGMDLTWFRNLKDTPALLNARKVTGQGGRGHLAEPLFCPLEVMQWLVSGKRKKGRPLSLEKAWELLERHFPKVHSANSAADPRAGD